MKAELDRQKQSRLHDFYDGQTLGELVDLYWRDSYVEDIGNGYHSYFHIIEVGIETDEQYKNRLLKIVMNSTSKQKQEKARKRYLQEFGEF